MKKQEAQADRETKNTNFREPSYGYTRSQIARHTELKIGVLTGFQKACYFWGISLYEEGFGEVRLERLARRVMQLDDELGDAWTKSEEADYMQEQVDRILKKAYGKNFSPFAERNPYIAKFDYKSGGTRKWFREILGLLEWLPVRRTDAERRGLLRFKRRSCISDFKGSKG